MRCLGDLPGWLLQRRRVSGSRGAVMVRGGGSFGKGGGGRGVVFLEAEEVGVGRGGGGGGRGCCGGGFGRIGAEELGAEEAGVWRVVLGRGERGVEEREVLEAGGGAARDEAVAVGCLRRGGRLGRVGDAAGGGRRRGPRPHPQPHGVESERGRHGRRHVEARLGVGGRERHGGWRWLRRLSPLDGSLDPDPDPDLDLDLFPGKQGRESRPPSIEGRGGGKGGLPLTRGGGGGGGGRRSATTPTVTSPPPLSVGGLH